MTLSTGPNLGLLVNGTKGEAHYDALMRFFRGLDTLVQPRMSTMAGVLPSSGLVDGLTVLYTGNDTNKNRIARYNGPSAAWEFFAPSSGWEVAVVDQLDANGQFKRYQYSGTGWTENLTAGGLTLAAGDARYERLVQHNLTALSDPTPSDDSTGGYSVLSRWLNTATNEAFLALDVDPGAANWQKSTLTVDELGSAALATVGLLDPNIPTVATVKNLLTTLAVFTAGSAVSAGVKGLVPAPPQSEVLRYLRSDGVWAFFEVPEGVELSTGLNIGEEVGTAGLFFQTVGDTLQFRSLKAADESVELEVTDSQILIKSLVSAKDPTSIGTGTPVFAGMSATESAQFRSMRAGENVTILLENDTLVFSSTGGGGDGGNPTDAVPTSVVWTDISSRLSGATGTPLSSITAFAVSALSSTLEPLGLVGHSAGASLVSMTDGAESLQDIPEMSGLGAVRVFTGVDHMFAVIRSDGTLLATNLNSDTAWGFPDFGATTASAVLYLAAEELWLGSLQDGSVRTFGTVPLAPVTTLQSSMDTGPLHDIARNPTTGVVIGIGAALAARTSDMFTSHDTLDFMQTTGETRIAADNQGNWAVHAVGTPDVYRSHDDGVTWAHQALAKSVYGSSLAWSGGVFLLSGRASVSASAGLFFTSVDAKDWNEIAAPAGTPYTGASIFPTNRIMYFAQPAASGLIEWYEGAVTPGVAGTGGTGGEGRELTTVAGGVPVYQGVLDDKHAVASLIPAGNVQIDALSSGALLVSGTNPVWLPHTTLAVVADEAGTPQWAVTSTADAYLEARGGQAYFAHWEEDQEIDGKIRRRDNVEAFGYTETEPMVYGMMFKPEESTVLRVHILRLTASDGVEGSFTFAHGDLADPLVSSRITYHPQGTDFPHPVELSLEPGASPRVLRIEPPTGCKEYEVYVWMEASVQGSAFRPTRASRLSAPFDGGMDDPTNTSVWTNVQASPGWHFPDGFSHPMAFKARIAFGMVEFAGLIQKTSSGTDGLLFTLPEALRPTNLDSSMDSYGYPLPQFAAVVDTAGVISFASVTVAHTGDVTVSPVPSQDGYVHLTGIRFPSRWYMAEPV